MIYGIQRKSEKWQTSQTEPRTIVSLQGIFKVSERKKYTLTSDLNKAKLRKQQRYVRLKYAEVDEKVLMFIKSERKDHKIIS